MTTTSFDRQFKVTSQGNLRLLIDAFTIKSPSSVINYGGGFVDMDDNSSGYVVVDSGTLVASVTTDVSDSTKVYLCIVQSSQGIARIFRQFDNAPFLDSGGGGSGPAVIAPLPGIGDEGEVYSQQIRTTGNVPQTFATTSGAIPTGYTLDASSGIIFGQCDYPDGGLYTGTIHISNAYGSVDYAFSILVNGVAPAIVSSVITPANNALTAGVLNTITPTVTGSTGGSPAVLISYAFTSPADPLLNASLNTITGVVTMTPDESLIGSNPLAGQVTATNYFGNALTLSGSPLVTAPVYWGEWHGALPGLFTVSSITTDLFDDATPGPRVGVGDDSYSWAVFSPFLPYPATGVAYARVLAIPSVLLASDILQPWHPVPNFICDVLNTAIPCADLTPAWPTPYQSGLVINGVTYDIYVITARTAAITISVGN